MIATSHSAFFGDRERTFAFSAKLIRELESVTETGIGGLFRRLSSGDFRYADILALIRLGLVGGDCTPEQAAQLVSVYAEERPIAETYPLALDILTALWVGRTAPPAALGEPEAPTPSPEAETTPIAIAGDIGSERDGS